MSKILDRKTIGKLKEPLYNFNKWHKWVNRADLPNSNFPGVYIIAKSNSDISGHKFLWIPEIIYIGMTNSKGGLKSRLNQFDKTLCRNIQHGGADRMLYKYRNYEELENNLYVSTVTIECDVKSNRPEDLRLMGEVLRLEFICFAEFVERFGHLPEFNNKKTSPKYSLMER